MSPLYDLVQRNAWGNAVNAKLITGNIFDIYILHKKLWEEKLRPILKNSRETSKNEYPLKITSLVGVFSNHTDFMENMLEIYLQGWFSIVKLDSCTRIWDFPSKNQYKFSYCSTCKKLVEILVFCNTSISTSVLHQPCLYEVFQTGHEQ